MQAECKRQEISEALGRAIAKLRKDANLSSRAVAYGMNMSKTTLLLAEKGKLDPQISTFCKIAEAFYIKPDELMSLLVGELPDNYFLSE